MQTMRRLPKYAIRELWTDALVHRREGRDRIIPKRIIRKDEKPKEKAQDEEVPSSPWPRKIFSGIQPTGSVHLGNYLGAIQKWIQLQNANEDVTYCIVDLHSITLPQEPAVLRVNIMQMAATLLACGIDPEKTTLFVQSAVKEHSELCWILNCHCTMARLGHLPQFKEKTRMLKDIPMGLYVYPVLQAADIMLYKSTHVPVGEDQIQHIQLTQHLSKTFNTKFSQTFPICHAMLDDKNAARIRSLRDPLKKMSKSDTDTRATVSLTDSPDLILDKIKKAITDFTADVTYDPKNRPGVSNLIAIHSLVTGQDVKKVVEEASTLNTASYKIRVADAIIEHLAPIRQKIMHHMSKPNELLQLLDVGARKAREIAQQTMTDVRLKVGLGAQHMPAITQLPQETKVPQPPELLEENIKVKKVYRDKPVPQQALRVENTQRYKMEIKAEVRVKNKYQSANAIPNPMLQMPKLKISPQSTPPARKSEIQAREKQAMASPKLQPPKGEQQHLPAIVQKDHSLVEQQQQSSLTQKEQLKTEQPPHTEPQNHMFALELPPPSSPREQTVSQSTEVQVTKVDGKSKSMSASKSDTSDKEPESASATP